MSCSRGVALVKGRKREVVMRRKGMIAERRLRGMIDHVMIAISGKSAGSVGGGALLVRGCFFGEKVQIWTYMMVSWFCRMRDSSEAFWLSGQASYRQHRKGIKRERDALSLLLPNSYDITPNLASLAIAGSNNQPEVSPYPPPSLHLPFHFRWIVSFNVLFAALWRHSIGWRVWNDQRSKKISFFRTPHPPLPFSVIPGRVCMCVYENRANNTTVSLEYCWTDHAVHICN